LLDEVGHDVVDRLEVGRPQRRVPGRHRDDVMAAGFGLVLFGNGQQQP
jgi:hypothetical protein